MQLRKLDSSEHSRTRALWEKVFPEDSKAFLDYYYFIKDQGQSDLCNRGGWGRPFHAPAQSLHDEDRRYTAVMQLYHCRGNGGGVQKEGLYGPSAQSLYDGHV